MIQNRIRPYHKRKLPKMAFKMPVFYLKMPKIDRKMPTFRGDRHKFSRPSPPPQPPLFCHSAPVRRGLSRLHRLRRDFDSPPAITVSLGSCETSSPRPLATSDCLRFRRKNIGSCNQKSKMLVFWELAKCSLDGSVVYIII